MSWTNRETRRIPAPSIFVAIAVCDGYETEYRPPRRCQPTRAMPGTAEKVAVLAKRLARGEELWHECDRWFGDF